MECVKTIRAPARCKVQRAPVPEKITAHPGKFGCARGGRDWPCCKRLSVYKLHSSCTGHSKPARCGPKKRRSTTLPCSEENTHAKAVATREGRLGSHLKTAVSSAVACRLQ